MLFRSHHNCRRSLSPLNLRRHPAVVLGFRTCSRRRSGVSHYTDRCEYCSDFIFEGTTEIVLRRSTHPWKPRRHWRPHAPSRAAQSCCFDVHAPHAPPRAGISSHALPTRRHAPSTFLHAPARALTRPHWSADVISPATSALAASASTILLTSSPRHLVTSSSDR